MDIWRPKDRSRSHNRSTSSQLPLSLTSFLAVFPFCRRLLSFLQQLDCHHYCPHCYDYANDITFFISNSSRKSTSQSEFLDFVIVIFLYTFLSTTILQSAVSRPHRGRYSFSCASRSSSTSHHPPNGHRTRRLQHPGSPHASKGSWRLQQAGPRWIQPTGPRSRRVQPTASRPGSWRIQLSRCRRVDAVECG